MTEKEFSELHQQVWNLLPWYLNQTLSPKEDGMVENHLSNCLVCRNELAQQQQLKQAVLTEQTEDHAVQRTLSNLHQRIRAESAPPRNNGSGWLKRTVSVFRTSHVGIQTALLAQAAVIVITVFVAVGAPTSSQQEYTTLTSEAVNQQAPDESLQIVNVIFAEDLTIIGLQQILEDFQLTINSGPSPAGAYKLSLINSKQGGLRETEALLRQLQDHPGIRFVAPQNSP